MTAEEHLANDPTSELWGEHRARYLFAARLAGNCCVVDVACGAGFGLHMLLSAGASGLGIDVDRSALAEARRIDASMPLVRADATRLPLHDASIDLITSFETLEHVPDARALVFELRRVLRPGGRLVLSTPNRTFGPPKLHQNPFHVREFSADELCTLLDECFATVTLYGQHPSAAYRFVPYLLIERRIEPAAIAWKILNRLPFAFKNRVALRLTGKPFYPGEADYIFAPDVAAGSHVLVAVAQ